MTRTLSFPPSRQAPALRPIWCQTASVSNPSYNQFIQEGKAFIMQYGGLSTFFGGLEAKIGAPNPKVRETMESEHTKAPDSQGEFTSGNYGITTTPQTEWWFIAEPGKEGIAWPVEEKLRATAESQDICASRCRWQSCRRRSLRLTRSSRRWRRQS